MDIVHCTASLPKPDVTHRKSSLCGNDPNRSTCCIYWSKIICQYELKGPSTLWWVQSLLSLVLNANVSFIDFRGCDLCFLDPEEILRLLHIEPNKRGLIL